ncbi:MAG: sigma-70 family RNA polymerase sigma factor [Clostridia bacterium]
MVEKKQIAILYEEQFYYVKKYFLKQFNHNEELANDLAQETFYKLLKHIGIYANKDTNKYYLFKIAENVKYDYIKHKANLVSEDILNAVIFSNLDLPMHCDVDDAKDKLTNQEKVLLSLFIQNLKSHEIAKIINLTPSAVRARISKLKKKLRVLLNDYNNLR